MDYKLAGVDINAGYKSVELIKEKVKSTFNKNVLSELGGFGGLFSIEDAKNMEYPVLVSGTDGVGTKLKVAFLMNKHNTIGIDLVAMCVNDIVCSGAKPLFFLDYIATGKNYPKKIESIVEGIVRGCKLCNTALIGGETAEMPNLYSNDEYDLAGFVVGLVDKKKIIDGKNICDGDVLIGIQSSGLHSNGYSLVRKVFDVNKENLNGYVYELGRSLGDELLIPTKIYVNTVLNLLKKIKVKGISHITGGGFIENIPRVIPNGYKVVIEDGSFPILPIFNLLMKKGNIDKIEMYNTFNMGIGLVLIVSEKDVYETMNILRDLGEQSFIIGNIQKGEGIDICLK